MIRIITAALAVSVLLAGCGTTVIKKEIVTVDKPVPFIPAPPSVPPCVSQVDKLVPEDAKDPGKVGQAYKYDMVCYRQRIRILELILDQYKAGSQNFDKINEEITALYAKINEAEQKAVDAVAK